MPQLMQLWGIRIVERAIQHNQVVFGKNGSGTWNNEFTKWRDIATGIFESNLRILFEQGGGFDRILTFFGSARLRN